MMLLIKLYEVLAISKKKKKNKYYLNRKKIYMLEFSDFEHDYYSRTAIGIYKIGHDSIRLMKWLAYFVRS